MVTSRVLVAAGVAALVSGLAACGTGTVGSQVTPPSQQSPRAAVVASMAQVKSSSYRFTVKFALTGLGQALATLGTGSTGAGAGGTGNDMAFTSSGAYSAPQQAVEEQLDLGSAGQASSLREIVFTKTGTVYASLGSGTGTAKWYELSGASGLAKLGSLFGSVGSGGPAGYVGMVNQSVTSVRKVATTTVDGTRVTEYAVEENLRTVLDKVISGGPGEDFANAFGAGKALGGAAYSQALTAALKAMPANLTFHVYLDGAGHLRRMTISIPLGPMFTAILKGLAGSIGTAGSGVSSVSAPTSGELNVLGTLFSQVNEALTVDITDYGAAVDIAAPPASEVQQGLPAGLGSTGSTGSTGSMAGGF